MNKIRALLLRPFTRALLTGPHPPTPSPGRRGRTPTNSPPARDQLGPVRGIRGHGSGLDGGILLARLPKGSLGEEGTRLVGSIVVAQAWAAATARAPPPPRAPGRRRW